MKNKQDRIGDLVLFTDRNSWIMRTISSITNDIYCHAGIVVEIKENSIMIAEALTDEFRPREYSYDQIRSKVASGDMLFLKTDVPMKNVKECIEQYYGTGYGFLQILAILIRKYTGLEFYKNGVRKVICSEAPPRVHYEASGGALDLRISLDKDFDYMTPADLHTCKDYKVAYEYHSL